MTIYILDEDPQKCAEMLDDSSITKMIEDISQVLCNVHYIYLVKNFETDKREFGKIPLTSNDYTKCKWSIWGAKCKANYWYLCFLADVLIQESFFRKVSKNKIHINCIMWAIQNIPNLPLWLYEKDEIGHEIFVTGFFGTTHTEFPLVMPKKYIVSTKVKPECGIQEIDFNFSISSYRNFYKQKVYDRFKSIKCTKCEDQEKTYKCVKCSERGYIMVRRYQQWSNRRKPEWL